MNLLSPENRQRTDKYVMNWSKNIRYSSDRVYVPENEEQLRKIVTDPAISNVKVIGTRHCFNFIADTHLKKTEGSMSAHVSLEKFNQMQFFKIPS